VGQLEEAQAAYQESLQLHQTLLAVVGETPQALRDLSISLDNLGHVEEALGHAEIATALHRQSREILAALARAATPDPGPADEATEAPASEVSP
jgi:tetratricopeptide (TPR) repeat protein